MHRILANRSVMVTVLTVALAGDFVRNLVGVVAWTVILGVAALWGVAVVIVHRVSWRDFPMPLIAVVTWWTISPLWSPYPLTSLEMLAAVAIAVAVGSAMVTAVPLDELIGRGAISLRIILIASLLFEIGVALSGHPIYPVGFEVTPATPIEAAWSRGEFFDFTARIQGVVGNANVLAMLGLVALIVAVWRIVVARTWRTVAVLDAVVALVVVIRTASATVAVTAVGLLVIVALTAMARRRGRGWRGALLVALLAIVGGIAAALANWTTVAALLGKSPDLTHRFDIWSAVLARAVERPVTGFGFVGWWPTWDPWFGIVSTNNLPVSQAHNVWIDLFLQTGGVGVALFAVALASILIPLWRGFHLSATSLATVPFLIVTALTIQSLTESRLLHEWGLMSLFAFAIIAQRLGKGLTSPR